MVRFLFLKIICCRYFNPLNLLTTSNNVLRLILNFLDISITKDKFCMFDVDNKYSFLKFFKNFLLSFVFT